ncbi:MAG: DEAD/DEAH box helicase [Desulfobulbaceae bacterium]|nr:DEAD/DEAH box helicase [Desulfobulbaceae bacterium]
MNDHSPKTTSKSGKKRKPKDDWDISNFEVEPVDGKSRFHDFDLPLTVMHGIADLQFNYCTPIQALTLKTTLAGRDAIGRAQTGTGKTAAFLITILNNLLKADRKPKWKPGVPRALVIAPTRELVMQIAKDGRELSKYCPITVKEVFGGMDYDKQQKELEVGPSDILIATPGRLLDFQKRRVVDLRQVEILVIDEADRMLDMGFIPDVTRIVQATPRKEQRQTLMYSATLTPEVKRLAERWCTDPSNVEIEPEQVAVDTVKQIVYMTTDQEKYAVLYNMITKENLDKVLVFTNRKDETRRLTERLRRNNIRCSMLSGDVAQKKRTTTLEKFRSGEIKVLVATDVAGRGIHIDGITHVFNYTLPYEAEDYVHRIGRTGRAGHAGIAISFADEEGGFYLPAIEEYIGTKLSCTFPDDELLTPPPKGTAPPESDKNEHPSPRHHKPRSGRTPRKSGNYRPRPRQAN